MLAVGCALASSALAEPGVSPGPGIRYATDAYPGFDSEDDMIKPAKKEPRWFGFINGPACDTAADQLAYCASCLKDGSWRAARRGFDSLVREWPASPEAAKAQKALADLYLEHYLEYENAFVEYRYLLDFYSLQCDYDAVARQMYKTAEALRDEGKRIMFFRFANTVDVRRTYEALVLRAPGAAFVPQALLTIGSLREDEGRWEKAVQVYENLRNLHPRTAESKIATHREANARMQIIRDTEYNRARNLDTAEFLKLAIASGTAGDEHLQDLRDWQAEIEKLMEGEAYRAAKFYDSRTRTRRSAINAYERFLADYPASQYAPEARRRVFELQQEAK